MLRDRTSTPERDSGESLRDQLDRLLKPTSATGGYVPPKSRPLLDQLDLAYRIIAARLGPERSTWDEIAAAEEIPKRTLQHFHRGWLEGVGAPTKRPAKRRESRQPSERELHRLLSYRRVRH
jgi:hypothetical protein